MANKTKSINKEKMYLLGSIGIIALLIIISIVTTVLNNKAEETVDEEELTEEEIEVQKQDNITKTLEGMKERDRMEYYFGIFLGYIEDEEYEKAYDLLYDDFKEKYFPTLNDFEKYIPTIFSEMSSIEQDNIERNGDVYVLWVYVSDAINGNQNDKKEMNFVIKENDYNDFVLSFSVI